MLLKSSLKALADDPEEAKERFRAAAKANAEPCPSCGKVIIHRKGLGWCQDNEMSEKTLQNRIISRARTRGWKVAHVGRGWVGDLATGDGQYVTSMSPGWPDLTLAKVGHHLIFFELKREAGIVEPEQMEWLKLINSTGNYGIVLRPSDLRSGVVKTILTEGAPIQW